MILKQTEEELRTIFVSSCIESAARARGCSVCDRLHDPETELYIFSDAYIVDEIMMELHHS